MERTYCYHCATRLEKKAKGEWWCKTCKQSYFANPSPAAEAAIFNSNGEVLICTRAHDPQKGKLDLPGGFVDINESLEEGLLRELKEELDISPDEITPPEYLMSSYTTYRWGRENTPLIAVTFVTYLKGDKELKPADDVFEAKFKKLDDLKTSEFSATYYDAVIHKLKELHAK